MLYVLLVGLSQCDAILRAKPRCKEYATQMENSPAFLSVGGGNLRLYAADEASLVSIITLF